MGQVTISEALQTDTEVLAALQARRKDAEDANA